MNKLYQKISKCRISQDRDLKLVGKIGPLTLTGVFPKKKNKKIISTPVDIVFSKKSKLLQLNHNYSEKELFGKNYGYRSGLNQQMIGHLKKKSKYLQTKYKKLINGEMLDIGSNDGTFLGFFNKKIKKTGIDPTALKFKKYYQKNINIIPKLFDNDAPKIFKNKKFNLITSIAMFYDLRNPLQFLTNIEKIMKDDGILHIEIAYLPDILSTLSFDTFCQEHLTYFSYISFNNLIKKSNLKILDFSRNTVNGGSINFDLSFKSSKYKSNLKKIDKLHKYEKKFKIDKLNTFRLFFKDIKKRADKINSKLKELKKTNTIYGFGASTKGNVLLQFCKIDHLLLDSIYDVNKDKFNSYTPGTNIKIISENSIKKDKPDYVFFLIWHFKKTIKLKIKNLKLKNTKFIYPFPDFKIIKK
tara:strand:+ start:1233 stop:2471 length:1239 start_codon:yes stop_codon:yes gene_type:complete